MKRLPQILRLFKGAWLLLITASVIGAAIWLFDSDNTFAPFWFRAMLGLSACVAALVAWRTAFPRFRRSIGCLWLLATVSFGAIALLCFFCNGFGLPPDTPQEAAKRHQYETLEAAIKSKDIGKAQNALVDYTNIDSTPDVEDNGPDSGPIGGSYMHGERPLRTAVVSGNVPIAELLLDHGANPANTDTFAAAVAPGGVPMLKLLIRHGAFSGHGDAPKEQLRYALWSAVNLKKTDVVALLLHYGADPNSRDPNYDHTNRSLLHLARSTGNLPIAKMLKQAGAKE